MCRPRSKKADGGEQGEAAEICEEARGKGGHKSHSFLHVRVQVFGIA